jgi:hypothetical protein
MKVRALHVLMAFVLGLAVGLPAEAGQNEIRIQVAEERVWQCGAGWDPEGTGRWHGRTGKIYVEGQLIHEFDLGDESECHRVVTTSVEANNNQRISVVFTFDDGSPELGTTLTAWDYDRVWRVQYFVDQAWGEVVSTNWPTLDDN